MGQYGRVVECPIARDEDRMSLIHGESIGSFFSQESRSATGEKVRRFKKKMVEASWRDQDWQAGSFRSGVCNDTVSQYLNYTEASQRGKDGP